MVMVSKFSNFSDELSENDELSGSDCNMFLRNIPCNCTVNVTHSLQLETGANSAWIPSEVTIDCMKRNTVSVT